MKPKTLIIGIDGGTWKVLKPLIKENKLPYLKKLMASSAWGTLETTIPPITAVAWSSFVTGKNPGQHGLFDFLKRKTNSYQLIPIDASQRKEKAIWDIMNQNKKKTMIIGVPVTYPPTKIDGVMLSGMLTPKGGQVCSSKRILKAIQKNVGEYLPCPEKTYSPKETDQMLNNLIKEVQSKTQTSLYLMENYDWDCLMVVFNASDGVMHAWWQYWDKNHPRHQKRKAKEFQEKITQVFQEIDQSINQLTTKAGKNPNLFIMSDHGLGPLENFFQTNNWLIQEGFLVLRKNWLSKFKYFLFKSGFTYKNIFQIINQLGLKQTKKLDKRRTVRKLADQLFLSFQDVDWNKTKAYSLGYIGQIYLNLQGREPQGIIKPGKEYQETRNEIIKRLRALKHPQTKKKFITQIYKKEKIYQGKNLNQAPDIIFYPDNLKSIAFGDFEFASNKIIDPAFGLSGHHRMDGIWLASGQNIRKQTNLKAQITDLAPTILYLANLPFPKSMDGKIIRQAIKTDFLRRNKVKYEKEKPQNKLKQTKKRKTKDIYSAQEKEEIKKRLKALGYVS
jgi:predicted AlkP superfamily phosphohydrolase/phosphomutase